MTILGGFRGFFMQGLGLLAVGYLFYYGFTTFYPQYADNYLYLGFLALGYVLVATLGLNFVKRVR